MKIKNTYIALLVALLFISTACDDCLDRYPKDSTNSKVFFATGSDLKLYTDQFYMILPDASDLYGELSDEVITTNLPPEVMGTRNITSGDEYWTWDMLRHINYFLQHSSQCDDVEERNHYEGIAYFFRAFFYFDKVKRFGDVPWYDQPIGSSEDELLNKSRDSRELVVGNIIGDLDNAIRLLPGESTTYTVNKWTALALKSRVCLFEGTYHKYHGIGSGEELLQKCAEASLELMNKGGYTLYKAGEEPYRTLFASNHSDTKEVILSRRYNASLGLFHNATSYTVSFTQGSPGFTKRFVNQYLTIDGSRFTDISCYDTLSLHDEMTDRDPRMSQTIFKPGVYVRKGETSLSKFSMKTSVTGYQIIKYVMESKYDVYNSSECDMPLFRLGEVYLNYAEAKAELGTITQNDIDISVNRLRDRVGMPHLNLGDANAHPDTYMKALYPNVIPGDQLGVILEIRRERDIELVLEGFRYSDLMRWKEGAALMQPFHGQSFNGEGLYDLDGDGKTDLVVWKTNRLLVFGAEYLQIGKDITLSQETHGCLLIHGSVDNPSGGRTFREDRDYLYPIPVNDRILTNGTLKQNSGWDDKLDL